MDSLVGEESTCPCVHLWSRDHHQEKEPPSPPAGLNLVLCLFLISFSQRKPPSFQMLQAPWKSGFASVLSEEELKSLLMKVKEESEKVGLKLYIQKMKIMASGPIASWEIDGETVETVSDFIFLGSKITVQGTHGARGGASGHGPLRPGYFRAGSSTWRTGASLTRGLAVCT